MASTPLSVTLDQEQHDQAVRASKAFIRNLVVAQDGTVWAAESDIEKNLEAKVYRQDPSSGKTVATLTLPRPKRGQPSTAAAPKPSTNIRGLYLADNTLWITDYEYGTVYRYQVPATAADATAEIYYDPPATTEAHGQYAAIAYQASDGGKGLLWILDTHGNLVAFDLANPAGSEPVRVIKIGLRADALQSSLVFHAKSKTLWMTATNADTNQQQLIGLPVASLPPAVPTDRRSINLAGQTLAIDDTTLYIGCANGELWSLDLKNNNSTPVNIATLKNGDEPVTISSIAVDTSGYLWIVDDRLTDDGHVYGVLPTPGGTPPAHVQVSYALKKADEKPAPAVVAWHMNSAGVESLYVSDQSANGRVIRISPLPNVPPIHKDGTPNYTLAFVPSKGTADTGTAFGAKENPTGVKLHAQTTGSPPTDIAVGVSLQLTHSDLGVLVTLEGNEQRLTSGAAATPLAITDLKVDSASKTGHATLTAVGRGRPPRSALFDGEVAPPLTSIMFSPDARRVTTQNEVFGGAPVKIVTTPPTVPPAKLTVKVKLDGPKKTPNVDGDLAHFDLEPHYSADVDVGRGDSIGVVIAGKLAGSVTLTPSVPGHTGTPMIWAVIPVPTHLKLPTADTNLSRRRPAAGLAEAAFRLYGRERLDDSNSSEIPVPGWKLKLVIKDPAIAKFKGAKSSNSGTTFIGETNAEGALILTPNDLQFERSTKPNQDHLEIEVRWKATYTGADAWIEPRPGQQSSTSFHLQE